MDSLAAGGGLILSLNFKFSGKSESLLRWTPTRSLGRRAGPAAARRLELESYPARACGRGGRLSGLSSAARSPPGGRPAK